MSGKTIRIFLANGEPIGIFLAEISNWTGNVLVAPRSQLEQRSNGESACLGATRVALQSQLLPRTRVVA